ncbi:3-dehydroquinate synthase [Candidatus Amarobacter glycogenicus]|uniref:3-dehydroquinate synthase n=1 Tax=Candidatus Amarobacter glycogenicus TaxID=3140699 RepID=UPI003135290D|nr:3-dehydroquinate synthase [Dehalococcoidia bacterium]MBK9343423.1 3-dehydroquinate synthase [Dehalococcoidia bacterium]MBK9545202.1 3-dehydroquinate synthase [Dehalococcoidia bacterium]
MVAQRIFLVGLSGGGKSTAGRLLAQRLGWQFADSDDEIEHATGRKVPEIFAEEGEAAFRKRECDAIRKLAQREPIVIATGGGAVTVPETRALLGDGFVVWLSVSPEEAARRLGQDPATSERPLLAGDTRGRLEALLQARRELYSAADAAIDVDDLSPQIVSSELFNLWQEWARSPVAHGDRLYGRSEHEPHRLPSVLQPAAIVRTPTALYPVIVADGCFDALGTACRDAGLTGRAFVISDTAVGPLFAGRAAAALEQSGYQARTFHIPAGEDHKTLATVELVYDWLIGNRVERSDFAVCVGGGVVTDLAGFAAATCLRGIDFVHVPTSLLAMADAAIGGKTGVDHPRGKNMIGAFAQPRAVLIDPLVLRSLPERHLRNGWAELIKHGLILDEQLFRDLEDASVEGLPMMSAELIARSVAIKADVVSDDEREAGRRTLLNYGHTIGHAIEAVTGFSAYLHGEAISVGMRAAGLISHELGLLGADGLARQQALLQRFGLPGAAPGLDVDAVIDSTLLDKKVRGGSVRWVLLEGIGNAVTRDNVPADVVRRAVEAVLAP